MTKLSLKLIEKYNLDKQSYTPDYDDKGYIFTLPSGIELSCLFMCNGEPCDTDSLEGLDGYIYIQTEEELIEYINLSYEDLINKVASENENFNTNDYIDC
jgi:hypothetical protein